MNPLILSLNLKDTEPVHLDKALSSYLKSCYGHSQYKAFFDKPLALKFDNLRVTANSDLGDEPLLELNYKYVAMLEQLALRSGNNSSILKTEFTWHDARNDGSLPTSPVEKYTQKSLAIEKSSIIFNIAALLSKVGKEKITGGTQDYALAIKSFSKSYGCFKYLSENFLNSPSKDIKTATTKFLSNLMHAQAQELYSLKIINSPDPIKQASLLSKMAFSTHKLYAACEEFYGESPVTTSSVGVPSYGEAKWKDIIHFKQVFYKSLSAYYHAAVLENGSKIGEAIGFLELSKKTYLQALPLKLYVKDMDFEVYQDIIEKKLASLIKDNDYIYHDTIPAEISVDTIKAMDAIKPVSYMESQLAPYMSQVSGDSNVLFRGIVPIEVYEKASLYSEKKSSKFREENETAQTADWEYDSFVEYTNLAKVLPDLEGKYSGSGNSHTDPETEYIDQQISRWSKEVMKSPYNDIPKQQQDILKMRKRILDILSVVSDKENSVKLKSSLVQASQSDEKLFAVVSPYQQEIALLKNFSGLKSIFDSYKVDNEEVDLLGIDDSKNEMILAEIKKCKETFNDLRLLKRERDRLIDEMKQKLNNDESDEGVIQLILENQDSKDIGHLFDGLMEQHFGELSSRIEATIFKQKNLITEIKIQLDSIFKSTGVHKKSGDMQEKLKQRNEMFSKIEEAYNCFKIFANDLPKGINFYSSLLTMVNTLKERESQSVNVTHQFGSLSMENGSGNASDLQSKATPPMVPSKPAAGFGLNYESSTAPKIPQRPNELESKPTFGVAQNYSRPQLPLKPSSNASDINKGNGYQGNPTAFYNNPSVFDESLYNSFK